MMGRITFVRHGQSTADAGGSTAAHNGLDARTERVTAGIADGPTDRNARSLVTPG